MPDENLPIENLYISYMILQSTIQIETSQEIVWQYIIDPSYFILWQENYESTVIQKGMRGEKGTISRHLFREKGKSFTMIEEVIESIPNELYKIRLEHPVLTNNIEITLTANDGTKVKMVNTIALKAFSFKILAPFLKKSFLKRQDVELNKLKLLCEGEGVKASDNFQV